MAHADDPSYDPPAHILLVDDRPANLLALEAILDELGHKLVKAHSGEEAVRLVAKDDFAVVLLDVQMPGLSGFETARRIRAQDISRQTPIIFITAEESPAFPTIEAYRLGAVDYLVKPLIPEILRVKVRGFVELFQKTARIQHQADRLRELEQRERQRLELALRESKEHQRLWIQCVKDYAIFLMDRQGHITSWNEGAERLTGYPTDEILGQPFALLFAIEDRTAGKPDTELQNAAATGSAQDHNWIVRKDGSRFWAEGFTTALMDEAGKLRGFAKICRDLTEKKHLEDTLRQRAHELAEADRRKDEFLAMLGHELRNPLAPIRNAVQALRLRGADQATLEWAREMVERQVRHMTHLVDDLLDATRIQRGKIQLRRERLDLAQLVRAAADDHRPALHSTALVLALDIPNDPVWVVGDPTRLSQVVGNLLNNATKFSEPGGQVTVRLAVERQQQRAVVTLTDTGMGIEQELLAHLFEAFTQADRSLDRSRGGLGLGLAVVKGLVELHGGEVKAESDGPGRGSTFTFWLPLTELPASLPKPPDAINPTRRRLKILVVDDIRDGANSLRVLLEALGHEVAVAYTGPAAVEAARRFRPKVVVCDIGLPEMDGYAVARALRHDAATNTARLIALSGYGAEADRRRSNEAGFDIHLVKPVQLEELQQLLDEEREE